MKGMMMGLGETVVIKHYRKDGVLLLHKELCNGRETILFKKMED